MISKYLTISTHKCDYVIIFSSQIRSQSDKSDSHAAAAAAATYEKSSAEGTWL